MRIFDGRREFYQWDVNVKITSSRFQVGGTVHFHNGDAREALAVKAYRLDGQIVADVPNNMLWVARPIMVYIYEQDEDGSRTVLAQSFKVIARPKPADYIYFEPKAAMTVRDLTYAEIQAAKENGDFYGIITQTTGRSEALVMSQKSSSDAFSNALKVSISGASPLTITDHSPNPHTVEVKLSNGNKITRYGKNLLNVSEGTIGDVTFKNSSGTEKKYFGVTLTLSAGAYTAHAEGEPLAEYPRYIRGALNKADGEFKQAVNFIENDSLPIVTFTAEEGDVLTLYSAGTGNNYLELTKSIILGCNYQVEEGDLATDYAPYVEPMECDIVDGVANLESIYPIMKLVSDAEGATIEATYNRDSNKTVGELNKKLEELNGSFKGLSENVEALNKKIDEESDAIELVQNPGSSETSVMSQKAVTDYVKDYVPKAATRNIMPTNFENAQINATQGFVPKKDGFQYAASPDFIEVVGGEAYTISWGNLNNSGNTLYLFEYDSNKNGVVSTTHNVNASRSSVSFILNETTAFIRIQMYTWVVNTPWQNVLPEEFQLERGEKATEYVKQGFKIEPSAIDYSAIIGVLDEKIENAMDSYSVGSDAFSNALKGSVSGVSPLVITDLSPNTHTIEVKANGGSKVTRYGKNLLNVSENTINAVKFINSSGTEINRYGVTLTLSAGTYTLHAEGTPIVKTGYKTYIRGALNKADGGFKQTVKFIEGDSLQTGTTFTADEGDVLTVYNDGGDKAKLDETKKTMLCCNYQVEAGAVATDYAPYVEPMECAVVDGVAKVSSVYPTTRLVSDTEGTTLEASYNKDINKALGGGSSGNLENVLTTEGAIWEE